VTYLKPKIAKVLAHVNGGFYHRKKERNNKGSHILKGRTYISFQKCIHFMSFLSILGGGVLKANLAAIFKSAVFRVEWSRGRDGGEMSSHF
jgi:hypothetical protein